MKLFVILNTLLPTFQIPSKSYSFFLESKYNFRLYFRSLKKSLLRKQHEVEFTNQDRDSISRNSNVRVTFFMTELKLSDKEKLALAFLWIKIVETRVSKWLNVLDITFCVNILNEYMDANYITHIKITSMKFLLLRILFLGK